MPVVRATWETEAGELLEPGGGGCSELRLWHCTPGWVTQQDSVSKKKKKNANHILSGKGFMSRIYREFLKLNNNKKTVQFKNGQRT